MKLRIFYTPNTPADHEIAYLQQRLAEHRIVPELIDTDTRNGAGMAEAFDVLARPAVVVSTDDGVIMQQWNSVPSAEEVVGAFGVV